MAEKMPLRGVDFAPKPPGGDFSIRRIYIKDISFETPNTPAVFTREWKPKTDINLRTSTLQLDPGEYEVTLTVTVTLELDDSTAFLAEVQQAGLFGIVGVTSDELEAVVGAYCPSILFPYAREMISELVVRGGFPPFVLAPVNFDALYEHQRAERGVAAAAGATSPSAED